MNTKYLLVVLVQVFSIQVLCKAIQEDKHEETNDVDEIPDWRNDKRYLSYQWAAGSFNHGVPSGIGCPALKMSNLDNGRVVCTTDTSTHIFCLPECIIGKTLSVVPQAFICRKNDPGHWKSPRNKILPTTLSCN